MNQAILFNDDLTLIEPGIWQISGFYQGEHLTFHLKSNITKMTDETQFDWEEQIEDWLESNETEHNLITIDMLSS